MCIRFSLFSITLGALVIFFGVAPANAGWIEQMQRGALLDGIHMYSSTAGYAVGEPGTLLHTTNSGETWSVQSVPFGMGSTDFNDVYAFSSAVYVVGTNAIIKSANGKSFLNISPPGLTLGGTAYLYGTDFINTSYGWVVGKQAGAGIVLRTTDGGSTWVSQTANLPPGVGGLWDISCVNAAICYAVGDEGAIVRTANGGSSWSLQTSGTILSLRGVAALSGDIVWTVGQSGTIRRTTNGGLAWTNPGRPTTSDLYDISLTSSSYLMIVGNSGTVLRTTDGGNNWTTPGLPAGAPNPLYAIDMQGTNSAWAVGFGGLVYRFDGMSPTVSAVTPTTVTEGEGQTYTVTYSDNLGVGSCKLFYSESESIAMSLSDPGGTSGTATAYHIFATEGSEQLQAHCDDAYDNTGMGENTTIVVSTSNQDPNPPADLAQRDERDGPDQSVGFVSSDSGIVFKADMSDPDNDPVSFQVEIQPLGIAFTNLVSDSDGFVASGTTVQMLRNYFDEGSYHWQARVSQGGGQHSAWVSFGGNPETEADFIVHIPDDDVGELITTIDTLIASGPPSPTTETSATVIFGVPAGTPVNGYTWECSLDGAVFSVCVSPRAYNSLGVGTHTFQVRTITDGTPDPTPASYSWTIEISGDGEGIAPPAGGDGGIVPGAGEPVTPADLFPGSFQIGDLVKLADDGNEVTFGDSSVFYLGADGGRYVFPNNKAYFSWYDDFSGVQTISTADIASIPLRGNVTYRPGTRMVKLQTSPTVYVVTAGGVLRAVPSEAVAVALYGADWNQQIDDINDAFWTNYGVDVALGLAADFNRATVRDTAISIGRDRGLFSL